MIVPAQPPAVNGPVSVFVARRRNGCDLRVGATRKQSREFASLDCRWTDTWDLAGTIRLMEAEVQFELGSTGSDHPAFCGAEGRLKLGGDVVGEIRLPPMELYSYEVQVALYGGRSRVDMTVRFPPRARTTAKIEWNGREIATSPSARAGRFDDLFHVIGFPAFRWGELTLGEGNTMAPAEVAALAICIGLQNSVAGQTMIASAEGGAS